MYAKDGTHITNENKNGDRYTVSSNNFSIRYSGGTARGNYVVDENTLTITTNGYFAASRLEGSSWTKK
jgi:hypothetical protein